MNTNKSRIAKPVLVAATVATILWVSAGDLNPPVGPITATQRTPIGASTTPGDADSLFKITSPGSYYLTGNITGVIGKHGVEIAVAANGPGVTVDLMGFELAGVPGSLDGISVTVAGTRNVAIRNGTVRAWGGDGIDIFNSQNNLLADLRAQANGARGVLAGQGSTIAGCTAQSNTGDGIFAGSGSTVTGCTVFVNTGDGIVAGQGSTVTGCTAFDNTGDGFVGGIGSTVTGCTASFNTGDGIEVSNDCRVTDNTCDSNGNAGDGAGIHATGSDNRIEANNVTDNDRGIDVDVAGNIIIKNTCSGNTTNWDIVGNNVCGPILDRTAPASAAILGNSAPSSLGSTDPNANFTY